MVLLLTHSAHPEYGTPLYIFWNSCELWGERKIPKKNSRTSWDLIGPSEY